VQGSIEGNGKKVSFAGRVAWHAPGDSTLNVRGKMGIAFAKVSAEIADLLSNRAAPQGAA
jgi:Tfp pilus assembly protein PilZ